jgi:hypothetical protein
LCVSNQNTLFIPLIAFPVLLCFPNLDLQNIPPRIQLEHLHDRTQILIRHHRILGPYLAIPALSVPVYLELLDLLALGFFVLAHELGAVGGLCNRGCDLLVDGFQSGFGARVEQDDFVAVGGAEAEEDGDGGGHGVGVALFVIGFGLGRVVERKQLRQ